MIAKEHDHAWVPLAKVFTRAKDRHKQTGKSVLESALKSGLLRSKAAKLITRISSESFEFTNNKLPILHKELSYGELLDLDADQQARRRETLSKMREKEEAAYAYAFKERPMPSDDSVFVLPGEKTIFVWTGIGPEQELDDAVIPFRAVNELILRPEQNALIMHCWTMATQRMHGSHYQCRHQYRRYEAEGVSVLQSTVDEVFPYSHEYPSRKPQARPTKWPREQAFDFLNAIYASEPLPTKRAVAERALLARYAEDGDEPSSSAVTALVKAYYLGKS